MKNVLIYYNNDNLLYLIEKLKDIYKFKHYSILKKGERAIYDRYCEVDIFDSINRFEKNSFDCAFIISESPFVNEMYYELYKFNIKIVYTLNAEYLSTLEDDNEICNIITKFCLTDKPLIGYIETHVYNQCNLNCKGCTHFSNIDSSNAISLESFEKNLSILSRLYNVNTLRLMGGEPFLNSDLGKYILIAKKYFPNTNIDIATNGLLLTSMPQELIKIIRENNIAIKVSLYIPTNKIMNRLEDFFNRNKIKHIYGNGCKQVDDNVLIRKFHKCLTLEKNFDAKYNSRNCFARECWFLKGSLLAKCVTPLQIEIINEKYNVNFEVTNNDFIDISKIKQSSWNEIEKMLSPNDFCKYCVPIEEEYDWEIKNKNQKLEDYIVCRR
ncbi:MAG: radical SAM protein [Bacilli bacterium]